MTDLKRITVKSNPISIVDDSEYDSESGSWLILDQGTEIVEVAVATKNGMEVCIRSNEMVNPKAEVFFYVKLEHPWWRPDGAKDYDEFVTDGETYYTAFRPLGKARLLFTTAVAQKINDAIQKFVEELLS